MPQELPPPEVYVQPTPDEDAAEADISEEEADVVLQPAEAASVEAEAAPPDDFTKDADHVPGETAAEGEQRRRRRRRRRRGGRREDGVGVQAEAAAPLPEDADQPDIPDLSFPADVAAAVPGHDEAAEAALETQARAVAPADTAEAPAAETPALAEGEAEPARAKRGRRGGRRRRKPDGEAEAGEPAEAASEAPAVPAAPAYVPPAYTPYVGPTPADPFASTGLDIFDAIEQAEQRTEPPVAPPAAAHADMPPEAEQNPGLRLVSETPVVAEEDAAPKPAEPVAGPVVQPIIVGSEAADAPKRKGWWRR